MSAPTSNRSRMRILRLAAAAAIMLGASGACSNKSGTDHGAQRSGSDNAEPTDDRTGLIEADRQSAESQVEGNGELPSNTPEIPAAAVNEPATRFAAIGARDDHPDQARLIGEAELGVALRDTCQTAITALYQGATVQAAAQAVLRHLSTDPATADVVALVASAFGIYVKAAGCEDIGGLGSEVATELEKLTT